MSAKNDEGSVVGEVMGLLPIVGRIVRRRVKDWVDETRGSLRETVRGVRRELERELTDEPEAAPPDEAAPAGVRRRVEPDEDE